MSLVDDALAVIDDGVAEHYPSQLFALFSGGDDSLTATAIVARHPRFSGCIHLDTRTGVPQTRLFVEQTCREQGWPLEVYEAAQGDYERLVLDGYTTRDGRLHQGFPSGPRSHNTMYYHLKQKQIQRAMISSANSQIQTKRKPPCNARHSAPKPNSHNSRGSTLLVALAPIRNAGRQLGTCSYRRMPKMKCRGLASWRADRR